MSLINNGQYGSVYKLNTVAIKEMDISRASSWLIELILARTLKCDKLMTARDITISPEKVSIIMDFEKCDLWSWRARKSSVSIEEIKPMIGDIATALSYLHFCMISHNDLKPSNILVHVSNGRPVCKVADFGYSSVLTRPRTVRYGTGMYSAPECIIGMWTRFEADIWALGLIISYVTNGRMPWILPSDTKLKSDRSWFLSAAYHWALHTNQQWPYFVNADEHNVSIYDIKISDKVIDAIMNQCLSVDRLNRPSAIEIAEELSDEENVGVDLSSYTDGCRCCDCNFDQEYRDDMKLLLQGEYVDLGDKAYEFARIASEIEFMPSLSCVYTNSSN